MLYILSRYISEYTSAPLQLGIFTSLEYASDAYYEYIEYYKNNPDPYEEQGYRESNLEKDVQIREYKTDDKFGKVAYMILGTCDGFGQIAEGIEYIGNTFKNAYFEAKAINKDNHDNCTIKEDGTHCCSGFIDHLLLDVIPLNTLRLINHSSFFNVEKCSIEELEFDRTKDFLATINFKIKRAKDIVCPDCIESIQKHNERVTKNGRGVIKSIYPQSGWPGLSWLEQLKTIISKWLTIYPQNLFHHEIINRLKYDMSKRSGEPNNDGVYRAFYYIIDRIEQKFDD
jgi:hypothetical protein